MCAVFWPAPIWGTGQFVIGEKTGGYFRLFCLPDLLRDGYGTQRPAG